VLRGPQRSADLFVLRKRRPGRAAAARHKLIARYRDAGLSDIAFDFYPGGRHEMLNEINRRQVQTRLLSWISRTLEKLNDDDHSVSTALELQH